MTICLIAIFKNESSILKEWIDHYIREGVDKFFLIDNGSDDNYHDILEPYINTSKVELVIDATKHKQSQHYNKYFLEKSKQYEWAIVCDLDEFIYSRNGFRTIKSYLECLDSSVSQVFIPWKMFGSNGYDSYDKPQPEHVVKSFTKRLDYDNGNRLQGVKKEGSEKYSFTKCIVRTKSLESFKIHSHLLYNHIPQVKLLNIHPNNSFAKISEEILENSCLHLNHYAIQSYSWFMKVKVTRGDVNIISSENIRNESYFKNYDTNDKEDLELSLKKY